MSIQQYALLDPTLSTVVQAPVSIDSSTVVTWVSQGNPKGTLYRIVNMIAQPAFDPATQQVVQNGWTITATDVEPVWQVGQLSSDQVTSIANSTNWNNVLAQNIIAACDTYIAIPSPTAAQTQAAVLKIVKVIKALLQHVYNVNN